MIRLLYLVVENIKAGSQNKSTNEFVDQISKILSAIQNKMFVMAKEYQKTMMIDNISSFEEMRSHFKKSTGFVRAKWCEDVKTEALLKEFGVTLRCIPYDQSHTKGTCLITGVPAKTDAIFAKAY